MIKTNMKCRACLALLTAALALPVAAADGGIVDVDTRLNVREAASASSAVKTRLWDGQVITLHDKSGNWWYVEYAPGAFGYVSADYVNELKLKSARVTTSATSLNVREGASSASAIKDKLEKGEEVLILGTYGDFYKVLYRGNLVGYASRNYITVGESQISTNKAVKLAVPSYKQYNYPTLRLPGSNEPVSTHGCAVTALAMTESYRKNVTVTPKEIISSERFTPSGAIYWPSEYTRGENSLDYILSMLKAGKPVIVHVKKSNGLTHFAVVYGFSGGDMVAGSFLILDPGTTSRTTFADLYREYPILVKTIGY